MDRVTKIEDRPALYLKSREHTPTTTGDVNFNSPGHRSSQDGSFIQDEDMHLILEFGQPKANSDLNQLTCSAAVVSSTWRGRNTEWATNFDANVAELDFDDYSARDIAQLKCTRYANVDLIDAMTGVGVALPFDQLQSKIYDLQRSKYYNQHQRRRRNGADCNHNKIDKRLRNSMDVSLGISGAGSMFSSSGGGGLLFDDDLEDEQQREQRRSVMIDVEVDNVIDEEALLFDRNVGVGGLAFISADSLDLSSLSINEENLKAVCATKKREYVLTFDKGAYESVVVGDLSSSAVVNSSPQQQSSYDNNDDSSDYYYKFDTYDVDDELTTWGRVKRSYEMGGPRPYLGSSKCTSLPNLNPSPIVPQRKFVCDGAEERMLSRNDEDQRPTSAAYNNNNEGHEEMSLSTSNDDVVDDVNGEKRRFSSLLQAFQTKCGGDVRLTVPLTNYTNIVDGMTDSSGYVTGTGSSQQCAVVTCKSNSSPTLATTDIGNLEDQMTTNNRSAAYRPQFVIVNNDDYEYAEFFVNGRYIDVNHNEIGFVPPSTSSVQRQLPTTTTTVWASTISSRRSSSSSTSAATAPAKPPRTFATLLEQNGININDYVPNFVLNDDETKSSRLKTNSTSVLSTELKNSATQIPVYVADQSVQTTARDNGKLITTTSDKPSSYVTGRGVVEKQFHRPSNSAPDLSFMKFPFVMPPLCPTMSPFLLQFLGETQPTLADVLSSATSIDKQPKFATTASDFRNSTSCPLLPDPPKLFSPRTAADGGRRHDSGLGASSGVATNSGAGGPAHIQDWESLATLLPKDVVQACSFFKANSNLLRSIDKPPTSSTKKSLRCRRTAAAPDGYQREQQQIFYPRNNTNKSRQFSSEPLSLKHCTRFESIAEEQNDNDDENNVINCCYNCTFCHHERCKKSQTTRNHQCQNQNRGRKFCDHCRCSDYYHRTSSRCYSKSYHHDLRGVTVCRPTWCHNNFTHHQQQQSPTSCHFRCRRTSSDDDDLFLERSDGCHQKNLSSKNNTRENVFYNYETSSIDVDDDCRRLMKFGTSNCCYLSNAPPSAFFDDDAMSALMLRSEFCCRPEVDLTDVQKFYSLPNYNFNANVAAAVDEVSKACATCYRVRSPSTDRHYHEFFCDCRTSDVVVDVENVLPPNIVTPDVANEELNLVENYENLKELLYVIVDCCAKIFDVFDEYKKKSADENADYSEIKGAVGALVFNSLCPSVETLLTDGLLENRYLWMVVQSSALSANYNINETICNLVRTLGTTEDNPRERSLQFATLVDGLLRMRSFDVWLSELLRNENLIRDNYECSSFVRRMSSENVEFLMDAGVKRLNLLPFERLNLIDVEIVERESSDTVVEEENQRRRLPQKTSTTTTTVVSLQKELGIKFCVPVTEWNAKSSTTTDVIKSFCRSTKNDDVEEKETTEKLKNFPTRKSIVTSSSSSSSSTSSAADATKLTTPTKRSRIPLLVKTKITSSSCNVPKNNLHITVTNQITKNFSKRASSNNNAENHFKYEKSYVCTTEKVDARDEGHLSFDVGETLILLEEYPNGFLKCERSGTIGLVARDKITYISFL